MTGYLAAADHDDDLAINDVVKVINKKAGDYFSEIGVIIAITCFDATVLFANGVMVVYVASWLKKVSS